MFYLLIGIGAFAGAISRHLLSSFFIKASLYNFPLGTLVVNLIGCYLIGVFISINLNHKELLTPLLIIGFLGSFTTFSAFTKEILIYANTNGFIFAYLVALIISSTCVFSTFVGYKMFS